MTQLNFDASQVEPMKALPAVPAGWYPVIIIASEQKPTSNGNGSYLELEMQITEGQYAGRKLYDRLNLNNQNSTTVEIAYRTLSSICHATSVIQVGDSRQLHNIPFEARAIVRPAEGQYDETNEVRGYRPLGGGQQNNNQQAHSAVGAPNQQFTPPPQNNQGFTGAPAGQPQNFQPPGNVNSQPNFQQNNQPPNFQQPNNPPNNQGGNPQFSQPNFQQNNQQPNQNFGNNQQNMPVANQGGNNQQFTPPQNTQGNNQPPASYQPQNSQNNGGPSANANPNVPPWQRQ